jgi:hypothetical protein
VSLALDAAVCLAQLIIDGYFSLQSFGSSFLLEGHPPHLPPQGPLSPSELSCFMNAHTTQNAAKATTNPAAIFSMSFDPLSE